VAFAPFNFRELLQPRDTHLSKLAQQGGTSFAREFAFIELKTCDALATP
jgi:hypothetical protein